MPRKFNTYGASSNRAPDMGGDRRIPWIDRNGIDINSSCMLMNISVHLFNQGWWKHCCNLNALDIRGNPFDIMCGEGGLTTICF